MDDDIKLAVGVASIADPQLIELCFARLSEQEGLEVDNSVAIACNGTRVEAACRKLMPYVAWLNIEPKNLGTCASWNAMIRWGLSNHDAVLILGDDVQITEPTGVKKIKAAVASDLKKMRSISGLGFSGFVMTKHVWDTVGKFDEGIWPAYFEDNDYHLRARKAGIEFEDIEVQFTHVGSGSLRRWKEWENWNAVVAFPINATRYLMKWGGTPGQEKFDIPWDGRSEGKTARQMIMERGIEPPWGW